MGDEHFLSHANLRTGTVILYHLSAKP
jgi:hypothetical protein